uniref:Ribosomal protein n=1 Tax=Salvator merianae TaxID=96440 RepID=A0A8D0CG80_SALMN
VSKLSMRKMVNIQNLNRSISVRSFSSWLMGHSKPVSPLLSITATAPHGMRQLPFLASGQLLYFQPAASIKCKGVLKRRCKDCFIVRRRGHLYVYCKTHPRHKQRKL